MLPCLRQADRLRARLVDGTRSLRVINRHCHVSEPCLLHPSKQTSPISRETSGLCLLWVISGHRSISITRLAIARTSAAHRHPLTGIELQGLARFIGKHRDQTWHPETWAAFSALLRAAIIHCGNPACRRPFSSLVRSSGRRNEAQSFTLETRSVGAVSRMHLTAFCASTRRPLNALPAAAIRSADRKFGVSCNDLVAHEHASSNRSAQKWANAIAAHITEHWGS